MATTLPATGAIALPRWQRWGLHATVLLLTATGIGWWCFAWPADTVITPGARTAATWLLRAHGIAAYGLLVMIGTVLPVHLRLGWIRKRNRWSGAVLVGLLGVLAATGLWLYYGPEAGREWVSTGHWSLGIGLPVWVWLHRARGLAARQAAGR